MPLFSVSFGRCRCVLHSSLSFAAVRREGIVGPNLIGLQWRQAKLELLPPAASCEKIPNCFAADGTVHLFPPQEAQDWTEL